jgi:hypothetical protein
LRIGQRVTVTSGPLSGLEGILVEVGRRHLVLSVTLLQRSIAVQVENSSVLPLPEKSRPEPFVAQSSGGLVHASVSGGTDTGAW